MKTWFVFFVAVTLTTTVYAEKKIPPSADTVIATWPVLRTTNLTQNNTAPLKPNDPVAAAALANTYLAEAAQPGQSRLYGMAHATLKPFIEQDTDNADAWMAYAQVQQHQHAFDSALAAINQSLLKNIARNSDIYTNAHLLSARIYLIQDNPAAARTACLQLLGNTDLLTTTACTLEVTSFQGDLAESYQQLTTLVEREGLPRDERGPWLAQVLADMAMRLGNPAAAEQWLDRQGYENASVNYLTQWAEVQLALGQSEKLLQQLQPIVENAADKDDALILRLALAEKNLPSTDDLRGDTWSRLLHQRMALREQRGDTEHASELARYYIDIETNAQKALHWAEINWQSAREYSDKKLLERATALANKNAEDNN